MSEQTEKVPASELAVGDVSQSSDRPTPFMLARAIIGWSNRTTGCEVYEDTLPEWPRWLPRAKGGADQPVGRLFTDAVNDPEGARALVLLFPRGTTDEQMQAAENAIQTAWKE
jgi:hypothetical protein